MGEEMAEAAATGKPVASNAGTMMVKIKGYLKVDVQMKSGDQTL